MPRPLRLLLLTSLTTVAFASAATAGRKYVGVKTCRTCHKAAERGDQYSKWKKGPHAKAYATLGTDKAKKLAAEAGVSGDPQKSDQCLKCHVTGYGKPPESFGRKYRVEDGVGCESCHGAGSDFKTKSIMRDRAKAKANGLIEPDEKLCRTCHNKESPTFKPFDFEERKKEISHPLPPDKKKPK